MPWMNVTGIHEGGVEVHNVINTDEIVRFSPMADGGTFIRFTDGTVLHVTDPMQEIIDVVLNADAKKVK